MIPLRVTVSPGVQTMLSQEIYSSCSVGLAYLNTSETFSPPLCLEPRETLKQK